MPFSFLYKCPLCNQTAPAMSLCQSKSTVFSIKITTCFSFRQILSKQEIEAEKNKAELALYKAQINPHFLFNTLNALYGLVLTKSDKTESAFIKFSNILKYMYAQTTSDLISISNEVEYIRQYVDLQSLRLNKHTKWYLKPRWMTNRYRFLR
mgnify:CR=1 FL=1